MPTRPRPRPAALLLVSALLAGCTGGGEPDPPVAPTADAAPSATGGPQVDEPVATVSLTTGGGVLDVDVLPLVRVDGPAGAPDLVVLTLDLSVAEPAPDGGALELVSGFADLRRGGFGEAGALRLLDLDSDRVHLVAADADGKGVATDGRAWRDVEPDTTARLQALYAAPPEGVEAVSLLVPGAALVDEVPVVDGEVPAAPTDGPGLPPGTDLALDPSQAVAAAVLPLEVFTAELAGAVRTLDTEDSVRVDLAADVLFAVDSADLAPQAQASLVAAAEGVRAREPGPVQVVGHTDDQGTPEYNLDLSQRRAQAVADALGPLLGPEYPLDVQARGETEPVADGTDDPSRALNRRVALTVTTPLSGQEPGPVETSGELPPAPERTAPGAEGVLVDSVRPYRVRVPSVRLVQGHVVADVQITAEDELVGSPFGPGSVLGGALDPRGEYSVELTSTARSLVLLQGSTAVYSLDHVLDPDDPTARLCTCDPQTNGRLDGGQTSTSTVVFPEVDVSGTVVLQVGDGGSRSFRLVDVPVG